MTRNDYWKEYAKRLAKLEKKYVPKVYQALKGQLSSFTGQLRSGNYRPTTDILNKEIGKVVTQMHVEGAISEGRLQLRNLRALYVKRLRTNAEWTRQILELLAENNAQFVVSISKTTREYLLEQLQIGLAEGLSLNEIADKLDREVPQIYLNRSFAIARTELNRATNLGTQLAAKDYSFETEKTWITARDHRVRGSMPKDKWDHTILDGKKIDTFDSNGNPNPFNNGENINQPGDPNASPGNTINCRCTIALTGKRDSNGRLIRKPSRLLIPI